MTDRSAQIAENQVPAPGAPIGPKELPNPTTSSDAITPGQRVVIEAPRRTAEAPRRTAEPKRPNGPDVRSRLAGRNGASREPADWRGDPGEIVTAWDESTRPARSGLLAYLANALPDWHREAACSGAPLNWFFPETGQHPNRAIEICAGCPVRAECLSEAMADPTLDHGVMGGTTAKQRKQMRKDAA